MGLIDAEVDKKESRDINEINKNKDFNKLINKIRLSIRKKEEGD